MKKCNLISKLSLGACALFVSVFVLLPISTTMETQDNTVSTGSNISYLSDNTNTTHK